MKILFILGAYKPRASANGLCSSNIIERLKNSGHFVTVLSNQNIGSETCTTKDGITVYRVKQRLYLRLKEYAEVFLKTKPKRAWLASFFAGIINKLQLMFAIFSWPTISRQTNKRFEKTAEKLYRANKYDAVISIYTPIESLMAGYKLKKRHPEVKFVPYFLDSLSGGQGPKCFSKKKTIKRGLTIERKVYAIADVIALMKSSEEHQKKYNYTYCQKMTFLDIPMLVKPLDFIQKRSTQKNMEPYKILYVGSIVKKIRNPQTLIKAFQCLDREDIQCEFVGNIDCIEDFEPLKKKMGQKLILAGFMNHDELVEKISSADILINIGNNLSTMVPSKIFEYMSFLKPIISTYDIEDEPSVKYLNNYPMALLLSGKSTPEDNALAISNFIQKVGNSSIDFETIKNLFYLNTPEAFDEISRRLIMDG